MKSKIYKYSFTENPQNIRSDFSNIKKKYYPKLERTFSIGGIQTYNDNKDKTFEFKKFDL